jgi:SAM-dependent methyltransferase
MTMVRRAPIETTHAVYRTQKEATGASERGNMTTRSCPGCGSGDCDTFYETMGVPAKSRLLPASREEAIAVPRGDVALSLCNVCGLVFNAAFDPGLVDRATINQESCAHSSVLRGFQERLADQLIERYTLHDKDLLEIGCGRGEFLALLCELGGNHGIGFDADAPDRRRSRLGFDATFRREPFSEYTVTGPTDLVYSRLLLEHLVDPARFVGLLRRAASLRKGARLFLQASNFVRTLRHYAFWEIHYQQCCYFSAGSLHRLLRAQGFTIDDIWTDFDGHYLLADARPASNGTTQSDAREIVETVTELARLVTHFGREFGDKQAMWREILDEIAQAGNRIAIWGADSRAVSFLTTLAVGDEVSYVVDLSPSRQGRYTPGTGHRIVGPDVMAATRPDVVIVMNSVFAFEIQELLAKAGCVPTLLIA